MMKFRMFTVDSFSSIPFSGNPAAVCLDDSANGMSEQVMQNIASEMNISETAFIRTQCNKTFLEESSFNLRWFTPTKEVPLCGHATLASAAVLYCVIGNPSTELNFQTLSGILKARKQDAKICLDLPLNPPNQIDRAEVAELLKVACDGLEIKDVKFSPGTRKLLVRLGDTCTRNDLEEHIPKIDQFMKVPNPANVQGVIITLKGNSDNGCVDADGKPYDFVSRYFSPWNGIPEDPVTGSAHTVLTPYWAQQLGTTRLYGYQFSKRGGELWLNIRDDNRLDIAGHATVVLEGSVYC